jgi:predicted transcriptional regulator
MTTITITLSDEEVTRLHELAAEAKLPPEELIQASVKELLNRPKEDFLRAATYVLKKNAELYRRLA